MRIYKNNNFWIHAGRRIGRNKNKFKFGIGLQISKLGRMKLFEVLLALGFYELSASISICFPNRRLDESL